MMAAVSVIIPTFNRKQEVIRAVSSILSQSFTDFEIIVVDDGSSDGTKTALDQFRDRITYIAHTTNRGVSAARNTGIKQARDPFIAFLDSDDYWLAEKLAVQIDFFNHHPQALICQTDEIWIRNGRRVNPKKRHLKPTGDIFNPCLKLCLVSPSAVMLKRSLFDEVGLFDEDLPACEDYDLWLRISYRYPIYLIKQRLIVKTGGNRDQLSSRYMGMDRFRIKALAKLIKSGALNEAQTAAAGRELSLKCRIYGNGCIKRGKKEEGRYYLDLPSQLKEEIYGDFCR